MALDLNDPVLLLIDRIQSNSSEEGVIVPRTTKKKKARGKAVNVYLDEDTYSLYGKEADRLGTSASALIKKAMERFIPEVKKMKAAA